MIGFLRSKIEKASDKTIYYENTKELNLLVRNEWFEALIRSFRN